MFEHLVIIFLQFLRTNPPIPTQSSLTGSDSATISTNSALQFQETLEQEDESQIYLKSLQDTELFNSSTFSMNH